MVNNDRIVPIQKIDLISMYGTFINGAFDLAGNLGALSVLESTDILGNFSVTGTGAAGTFLANQPVQTLDFAEGVTGATVYFVAGYDYSGMTIAGAATTPTGEVNPDGVTLYKAVLASGSVTITAVTPSLSAD